MYDNVHYLDGVETLLDDFGENMNVDVSGTKVEVKMALDRLVIHYEDKAPTPRPTQGPSSSSSSGLVSKLTHAKRILQRKKQKQSSQPTQELSLYLSSYEEEEDSSTHFTILEWWKKYEKRFLVLSMIARDLLMVPVSTVASESCFSTGSRILSKKRSRLSVRLGKHGNSRPLFRIRTELRYQLLYLGIIHLLQRLLYRQRNRRVVDIL